MARLHVLSIWQSLSGDGALLREWCRIGTAGQRKIGSHSNESGAAEAIEA
ncbi:WGR domain-containing protein [Microvirga sp. SYSU G3D207]|uniref:WGR domain-containing protein n=2 Tax=Microvirga arsenatis TaxID=2692265 RepID=A0ABW9YZU3_9HYPH|nr:WGR domain-containing protein [Microvirga arsenatis]NBJ24366.1 WGR domain-containing protein [Microvirga arsenatis]